MTIDERIATFLTEPESGDFAALARLVLAEELDRSELYRELCAERGFDPAKDDWRSAPCLPASASPIEPTPLAIRAAGTALALAGLTGGRAILDLAGTPWSAAVCAQYGAPGSASASSQGRLDFAATRSWLAARQRAGQPCLILAGEPLLASLLARLERLDLRFRVPTGSILVTCGTEATLDSARREVLAERLAIAAELGVLGWQATTAGSLLASRVLSGGEPELLLLPPWVRVLSAAGQEAAAGTEGPLAVLDLAAPSGSRVVAAKRRGRFGADGSIRLI